MSSVASLIRIYARSIGQNAIMKAIKIFLLMDPFDWNVEKDVSVEIPNFVSDILSLLPQRWQPS